MVVKIVILRVCVQILFLTDDRIRLTYAGSF